MTPILPPDKLEKLLDDYTHRERITREGYGVPLRETAEKIQQLATDALVAELENTPVPLKMTKGVGSEALPYKLGWNAAVKAIQSVRDDRISQLTTAPEGDKP